MIFVKKFYLLILSAFFALGGLNAQISNLCFQAESGAYTPLAGGNSAAGIENDDANAQNIPLGFTFNYLGSFFTQVSVNSNGILSFNNSNPAAGFALNNTIATTNIALLNALFPLWDDLDGSGGTASYLTTGTAGGRVFTMEWRNWMWASGAAAASISFQIKLYEGTNIIEFIYNQEAGSVALADPGASIGLNDATGGSGHYLSLDGSGASPMALSNTPNNSIGTRPATGQIYRFIPSGTPTITGYSPASVCVVGTSVTITGTNFVPCISDVSFNGTPATVYNFVDANTITATVPAGTTTGPVTVTTPGGTATGPVFTMGTAGTISLSSGDPNAELCVNSNLTPSIVYAIGGGATGATITAGALPAGMTGAYSGGTFTISGTPTASGSFPFTVTTSGSACTNPSLSGTITVDQAPAITSDPSLAGQNLCVGETATTLSVTATGATGYQWFSNTTQTNTGGTSLGAAGQSQTYTPSTAVAGTLYYYCVVLGDCLPSAKSNASGAIVVSDPPASYSVTGTGTYCSATGGNVGLTNSENGVSYQLFRGATPLGTLPGTGLALDFGAQTITGTYTVVATNATTTCTSTMTGSAVITIDTPPAQPGVITGPATICENTTKAYSIGAVGGATGYTWSYSGTGATINGTGTNITIDFATGATSGTLSVTADNSCGSSTDQTLAISVNSTLPASVSIASDDADNIICAGTSVTFTATPTNGGVTPSYQWKLNGSTNVGANNPIYTTTTLSDGDVITVILTSSLTCATGSPATSNQVTMTVNAIPPTPGPITQPANKCSGSIGNTFSIAAVAGATSYTWSVTGTGWAVTAGGTTTSATINIGTGVGTVSVTATNVCGTSAASTTGNITPTTAPATPGAITQPANACASSTGNTFSIAAVGGATSYTWSVTGTGWAVTAGGTTTSATITIGTGVGTVSVTATNACGTSAASTTGNITPTTAPATPGAITQPANACASSTGNTFSIAAVGGATSYTWSVTGTGWAVTAGGTTTSATITIGTGVGTVSVTATNACGTSAASTTGNITPTTAPATPGAITQPANKCASSTGNTFSIAAVGGATSYTWSVTGTGWAVTAGGTTTSATITIGTGVGTVSVTATNACGTSAASTTGNITPTTVPPTPGVITQPTNKCSGSTGNTFSIAAVAGATSYTWSVTGTGWAVTAGGTTLLLL